MAFEGQPWEEVWAYLESEGWQIEQGPRGKTFQTYYLPPGVSRGNGFKNRVDYFDSKTLVLRSLSSGDAGNVLQKAKAAKPVPAEKRAVHGPEPEGEKANQEGYEDKAEDRKNGRKSRSKGKVPLEDLKAEPEQDQTRQGRKRTRKNRKAEPESQKSKAADIGIMRVAKVKGGRSKPPVRPDSRSDSGDSDSDAKTTPSPPSPDSSSSSSSSESSKAAPSPQRQDGKQELQDKEEAAAAQVQGASRQMQRHDSPTQGEDHPSSNALAVDLAPDSTEGSAQMQREQPSSSDLAMDVNLMKALIDAPGTREKDLLASLKRLEAMGSISVEVFRTTMIGKSVTWLLKRTRNGVIRAKAKALLAMWKDLVVNSMGPPPSPGVDHLAMASQKTFATSPAATPKRQAPSPQDSSPADQSEKRKRRKLHPQSSPLPREAHTPKSSRSDARFSVRPKEGSRCNESSCSTHDSVDAISNSGIEERDASNDLVVELESGEEVVLQCNLEDDMISLQEICSSSGRTWASDDNVSEAVVFWEELCSLASELDSMNESGLDMACGEC